MSPFARAKPKVWPSMGSISYLYLGYLVDHLPWRRGSVSDVTTLDREDRRSDRKPHTHRSHWCRWDWEDVHRSNYPPSRAHQTTVRWQPTTRPFIRYDHTCAHFLSRLSKVIGVGIENPEYSASLRCPGDLRCGGGVESARRRLPLYHFTHFPYSSRCKTLDITTSSIEAARGAFHRIYKNSERPNLVDNILERPETGGNKLFFH